MSIPSPLKQYHFHLILIWWHSPFKCYPIQVRLKGEYFFIIPTMTAKFLFEFLTVKFGFGTHIWPSVERGDGSYDNTGLFLYIRQLL
jgi:hypothetical protein